MHPSMTNPIGPRPPLVDRREFLITAALVAGPLVTGCVDTPAPIRSDPGAGLLLSRPGTPTEIAPEGLQTLGLSEGRDGRLYVPPNHSADEALPLLLLLHGAGGGSAAWFGSYEERGHDARIIMLAPDSRGGTWDLILGNYSFDVAFIDRALAATFDRCAVDPSRIWIAGFSDGASYSLGLGLLNGAFFSKVIAYSPGFLANTGPEGPEVFISHGTLDNVLPIATCSRPIVERLRRDGYDVSYVEFEGGHSVPSGISDSAIDWLTA